MFQTQSEPENNGPTLLSKIEPVASELGALYWDSRGAQSLLKSVTPPQVYSIAMGWTRS